ncbi:hypothetical protein C8Q69DRAFT_104570 [Paecilomyces variotii]|uniref:Uncharacterized protein n=1 Tax=Byssochlamys spectabilis TaxID=264951 RepID=A0A443HK55_BYSSP|nr:hypothetical protein C8Q69DRAFT_104570 [Paecilomyces variotii]RWQ92155.1 hypothetical protein C8Q69DRAFT_104570 [Paecilomyces variotii]
MRSSRSQHFSFNVSFSYIHPFFRTAHADHAPFLLLLRLLHSYEDAYLLWGPGFIPTVCHIHDFPLLLPVAIFLVYINLSSCHLDPLISFLFLPLFGYVFPAGFMLFFSIWYEMMRDSRRTVEKRCMPRS